MDKFDTHVGVAVPLRRSNVDTDQIIPAVYLKRVTRTGFEDVLFADNITVAGASASHGGALVLDKWAVQTTDKYTVTIPMQAGFKYRLALESWQGTGGAGVKLLWTYPGTVEHPIPARYLFGDTVTWLSDLTAVSATNGDGPYEKDQSNGGSAAEDGRQLTIQGQKFIKGLGVHADSELRFALNGKYLTFSSWIGIDDEASDATAASPVRMRGIVGPTLSASSRCASGRAPGPAISAASRFSQPSAVLLRPGVADSR